MRGRYRRPLRRNRARRRRRRRQNQKQAVRRRFQRRRCEGRRIQGRRRRRRRRLRLGDAARGSLTEDGLPSGGLVQVCCLAPGRCVVRRPPPPPSGLCRSPSCSGSDRHFGSRVPEGSGRRPLRAAWKPQRYEGKGGFPLPVGRGPKTPSRSPKRRSPAGPSPGPRERGLALGRPSCGAAAPAETPIKS